MCKSQLHYFIKKEYLVFLEDSMNQSHLVWIDITVVIIIKNRILLPKKSSDFFPDTDTDGDPITEGEIGI